MLGLLAELIFKAQFFGFSWMDGGGVVGKTIILTHSLEDFMGGKKGIVRPGAKELVIMNPGADAAFFLTVFIKVAI